MKKITIALIGLLCLAMVVRAQESDPYQAIAKFQFGQSRACIVAIEDEIRAAAPHQYKAIEAKLLGALKAADATVDGKRFILRLLSLAGSADCVPAVAAYLADDKLNNPARIALEVLACPEAGAALRSALGTVKGRLLAGVISSVGFRRDAQAIPALAALVTDANVEIADNAIRALGMIGTPESAKALQDAKVAEEFRRPVLAALELCAAALARDGKIADAAAIYKMLADEKHPPAVRGAGIRGLIDTLPKAEAMKLLAESIQSPNFHVRSVALAAFVAGPVDVRNAIVEQLPSFNADGQLAVLTLLRERIEVSARDSLANIAQGSADPTVKMAALDALARHGGPGDISMLIKLTAKDGSPQSAAARRALEAMNAAGVDDALIKQIEPTSGAERAVVLSVLAARRVDAATPVLLKLASGSDATVAAEAIKGLAALGGVKQLGSLAEIVATTPDNGIRDAAESTAGSICSRATDRAACADAILPALAKAKTPANKVALIRLLPRTKADPALEAVRSAMKDTDADVREAATRALIEWPELAAAPHLVDLAKAAQNPTHQVLAIRGYLRLANGPAKAGPAKERAGMYRTVLDIAQRPDEKKQALAGLGDTPSVEALDILQKYFKDGALANDAMTQAIRCARTIGFAASKPALAALNQVKELASGDLAKQAEAAIKEVQSGAQTDGYIVSWLMAGPYTGGDVFKTAFDPEKPGAKVEWRPAAATKGYGAAPQNYVLQLDKLVGGGDRCAYIKTCITSEVDQPATLEIGSDDGVKVFLNGKQVFATNAIRGLRVGQDKPKIQLKKGANDLLIKVIQGGGEWGACVRLVGIDGKPLSTVAVGLPE